MNPRMNLADTAPEPYKALIQANQAIVDGPLDATVRELVKIRASQLNGCAFCIDMHTREARRLGESEQRIFQLSAWRESPVFTSAERAALAYTDEVTRLGDDAVSDQVWDTAASHFSPAELGHLVAQAAVINAFNRIAVPVRAQP